MTQEEKDREKREKAQQEIFYCVNCNTLLPFRPGSGRQKTKFCSITCQGEFNKKFPDYYKEKRAYDKEYRLINKDKISEKRKDYWTSPKAQYLSRKSNLKTRYNLSEEEYVAMMDQQKGCCAICEESLEVPYIDHCHNSNKARGLLCQYCNTAIGHFKENIATMKRAIRYIEFHSNSSGGELIELIP